MTPDPLVEARGVRKELGGDVVLDGVDLTVHEGETTLVMGPNGSGKTVLLCCLTDGLRPDEGTVRIDGAPPAERREQYSLLLQGDLAVPALTGRETLAFYADLHPADDGRGPELADRLGIAADLHREVADYSGGMTRKLELAAALAPAVPLYVLDEPTVELDPTTVDQFHALLGDVAAEATVLLSSHHPADLALADRVVFFRDGSVVESGDPDDLLDDVPSVVRVPEPRRERVENHVLAGRFFETDGGARGFLRDGAVDEGSAVEGATVEAPGVTDLYNYYVHIVPTRSGRSSPEAGP